MRLFPLVLFAIAALFVDLQAALAGRVAMVIGNSAYIHANPLPNATNDASDIAARLTEIGFEVHLGQDLSQAETLKLVDDFAKSLHGDDVALFFYAGHGVQIGTENYIIPVDANPTDEQSLVEQSVKLQAILRTMELRSDHRIIILDACRNNPFTQKLAARGLGGESRGLAKVEAGVGSFIVFSTQPGNVALDGTGRNSPFTTALLHHIGVAGQDLHQMMLKVRADVVAATSETQVPWENSSLLDEVYLAGADAAAAPQVAVAAQPEAAQPQTPEVSYHYVHGLDPNGDGFLALRSGTSGNAQRLAKMPEGTRLEVLGTEGDWDHVRLTDGREGWAHSRWIACCTTAEDRSGGASAGTTAQVSQGPTCDDLWHARNAIWARYGYCFTSERGKAAFGTTCSRDQAQVQAMMSSDDRAQVETLLGQEAGMGCR